MTTFKDLNTILQWPEPYAPQSTFFFIRDSFTADGSFLLHHFMNSYLIQQQHEQQSHVKFVSFNQSYFHYQTIQLKLNMNLQKEGEAGRFFFVDAQQGLSDSLLSNLSITEEESDRINPLTYMSPINVRSRVLQQGPPAGLQIYKHDKNAKSLLDSLFDYITREEATKCNCLLLDHVDSLVHYLQDVENGPTRFGQLLRFIQKLLTWCNKNQTSLVLLMHGDSQDQQLANLIEQYATVTLRVDGLPTGYSKDVHGMLEVLYEKSGTADLKVLTRQTLHYKCFEHHVSLFSPGSHSDII
jgi:hypothetical protein